MSNLKPEQSGPLRLEALGSNELKALQEWVLTFEKETNVNIDLCRLIYSFTSPVYWCYNCYQSSNKKLLYHCKKCCQAKYCSVECWKSNRKYHKSSCRDLNSTVQMTKKINQYSIPECMESIIKMVKFHIWIRPEGANQNSTNTNDNAWLVLILSRVRSLLLEMGMVAHKIFETGKIDEDTRELLDSYSDHLHDFMKAETTRETQKNVNALWSVPGMPELILHERFSQSCQNPSGSDLWSQWWIKLIGVSISIPRKQDKKSSKMKSGVFDIKFRNHFKMFKLVQAKLLNLLAKKHVMAHCKCLLVPIPYLSIKLLKDIPVNSPMNTILAEKGAIESILSMLTYIAHDAAASSAPSSRSGASKVPTKREFNMITNLASEMALISQGFSEDNYKLAEKSGWLFFKMLKTYLLLDETFDDLGKEFDIMFNVGMIYVSNADHEKIGSILNLKKYELRLVFLKPVISCLKRAMEVQPIARACMDAPDTCKAISMTEEDIAECDEFLFYLVEAHEEFAALAREKDADADAIRMTCFLRGCWKCFMDFDIDRLEN